jgi:hypothetical protein
MGSNSGARPTLSQSKMRRPLRFGIAIPGMNLYESRRGNGPPRSGQFKKDVIDRMVVRAMSIVASASLRSRVDDNGRCARYDIESLVLHGAYPPA